MKLSVKKQSNFVPHPETEGFIKAVCVDRTELKTVATKHGDKEQIRYVFETECMDEENDRRFCIWSKGFTPSLHEKSALRPFLKEMRGRDLTSAEEKSFDIDDVVGMGVKILVLHNTVGDKTYANIQAIKPDKDAHLKPSGKYTRVKDREERTDSYDRADDGGGEPAASGWEAVVVHVGKHKGKKLADVDEAGVKILIEKWLPQAKAAKNLEDAGLVAALDELAELLGGDDIPY